MPANVLDENGFAPPISKSRFNPAAAQAVNGAALKCWLRNSAGEWLHFSGESVTTNKIYRWSGTPEQANALRRRFDFAKDFRTLTPVT